MREDDTPGVPLGRYRSLGPGMGVEFTCVACMHDWTVELEVVIERLARRGVGGAGTGIKEVSAFVEKPCPRCGGRRFDTRPDFPAAPNTPRPPPG